MARISHYYHGAFVAIRRPLAAEKLYFCVKGVPDNKPLRFLLVLAGYVLFTEDISSITRMGSAASRVTLIEDVCLDFFFWLHVPHSMRPDGQVAAAATRRDG